MNLIDKFINWYENKQEVGNLTFYIAESILTEMRMKRYNFVRIELFDTEEELAFARQVVKKLKKDLSAFEYYVGRNFSAKENGTMAVVIQVEW